MGKLGFTICFAAGGVLLANLAACTQTETKPAPRTTYVHTHRMLTGSHVPQPDQGTASPLQTRDSVQAPLSQNLAPPGH